jgi:CRP-like cAMP-binding protein
VETQIKVKEHAVSVDNAAFEKMLTGLPVRTYRVGETVLTAGSNTDQLLVLKTGEVAIVKDSIEIARVREPGAVIGELSALLGQPHSADVQALVDSQFHVADQELLAKDPVALLHVAKILARRLIAADSGLVELKKQLDAGHSPSGLSQIVTKIEEILNSAMTKTKHPIGRYY